MSYSFRSLGAVIPQCPFGCRSEDFAHEVGSHGDSAAGDLLGRRGRIIGHVCQQIENPADHQAQWAGDLEGANGIFDFVENIACIGPPGEKTA
jgi:hypothetical protein